MWVFLNQVAPFNSTLNFVLKRGHITLWGGLSSDIESLSTDVFEPRRNEETKKRRNEETNFLNNCIGAINVMEGLNQSSREWSWQPYSNRLRVFFYSGERHRDSKSHFGFLLNSCPKLSIIKNCHVTFTTLAKTLARLKLGMSVLHNLDGKIVGLFKPLKKYSSIPNIKFSGFPVDEYSSLQHTYKTLHVTYMWSWISSW